MEPKILHFTVDPEGVVKFARERYWFQDAKKHGVNILRCFIGIEPNQITKILEGDATFKKNENGKIYYDEVSDEEFKKSLIDFLAYRKIGDETNFMYLGGIRVHKDTVEEYANHVVKRLRETMRNTRNGIMFDVKDMDEILGLEHQRQDLHDYILQDAGFDRDDSSEEACVFKLALEKYVDEKAGTLMVEPIEIMDPEEALKSIKTSEDIMKYMDNLNLREAKKRGII